MLEMFLGHVAKMWPVLGQPLGAELPQPWRSFQACSLQQSLIFHPQQGQRIDQDGEPQGFEPVSKDLKRNS